MHAVSAVMRKCLAEIVGAEEVLVVVLAIG